jgi:hypothetical protein
LRSQTADFRGGLCLFGDFRRPGAGSLVGLLIQLSHMQALVRE